MDFPVWFGHAACVVNFRCVPIPATIIEIDATKVANQGDTRRAHV